MANATSAGVPAAGLPGRRLPEPRGPLSAAVVHALGSPCGTAAPDWPTVDGGDPFGEDLQLALHLCYELHYRGFDEVDEEWEWEPELLRFRARAETAFLDGLRAATAGGDDVEAELDTLLVEHVPNGGVSSYLRERGTWWQMREYLAQRSLYHLKEADPQAWVIPRLRGRAKAALVAVEFDEFGGGRPERNHAQLFAELLAGARLETGYLHYLDIAPAPPLAIVNMMSLFGLHRALRGAMVGHFAAVEITSTPSSRRMVEALRRMGAPEPCVRFYREHITADAVHEQVMRHEVIAGLLADEPGLARDVVLGIQATELLEERFARHLEAAWSRGMSSLRRPFSS